MTSYFVDTSFILALELRNDQNHQRAQTFWRHLSTTPLSLMMTSYIFDEVVTFFNSRGYHQKAVEVGTTLLQSPSIHFIHVDETLFMAGWTFFQVHRDKGYSLTDCISFVLMQEHQLIHALTFDHHFTQAGFISEPRS